MLEKRITPIPKLMKPTYATITVALVLWASAPITAQQHNLQDQKPHEYKHHTTEGVSAAAGSQHGLLQVPQPGIALFSERQPASDLHTAGVAEDGAATPMGNISSLPQRADGVSGYTTGLGLRGGYTSGISIKHFVRSNAALEGILGTRWEGFSLTGLYEWHKPNALGVRQLTWE